VNALFPERRLTICVKKGNMMYKLFWKGKGSNNRGAGEKSAMGQRSTQKEERGCGLGNITSYESNSDGS